MVPSLDWFIYAFVRKEAVVCSQIEGTQATLVDLFEYEAEKDDRQPLDDVREVCNYLDALKYARAQLASPKGLPLSMRLLHETHRRLMRGVRGAHKQPGEVRRSQNWIGGTRPRTAAFLPPPPEEPPAAPIDFGTFRRQCGLRTAASRGGSRAPGRSGEIPPRRRRALAPHADRTRACAVRNHPPVPRRHWPYLAPLHHAPARSLEAAQRTVALPERLFQTTPARVLSTPARGPEARRVRGLDRFLPRRRGHDPGRSGPYPSRPAPAPPVPSAAPTLPPARP